MIICTCGGDFAIGKDNALLHYCKEDLKYFSKTTTDNVVLMGNNTYKSLQALGMENGLPNRYNVVLSKTPRNTNEKYFEHGVDTPTFITDLNMFLNWGTMYANNILEKDTYIIGGRSVYEQCKDFVQEVYWTRVDKTFPDADTHFDMRWVEDEEVFEQVSEECLCEDVVVKVFKRL